MNTLGNFVLPLILGLPVLGAIFVMCTPKTEVALHRGIGMAVTVTTFLASLLTLSYFNPHEAGFQLVADIEWIPALGAHFKTGVDGISVFLVILTTFLMPLTLLGTGKAIDKHVREFIAAMLILEAGMLGAFVSLDVFLFYVFWEVMLIPMYLLIGIWGGQRRLYASIKFVIYTMVGSLLMLVAIFYLYVQAGAALGSYTTDLEKLTTVSLPYGAQVWCFAAFALAFAIKIPLFPLHTWLPDAHVEAPTAGSVILAGVLLKFGIYGFLRYAMPLFPHGAAVWAPTIAILSVIGIIYGAFVAFTQDDVKKLVAYSSVSHLGFCALGIFALTYYGIEGSIFAMLSHGLTTGGLFLGIGVLYERRHTRRLAEYGGIWKQMPVFAGLFLVIVMGSAGLPALSGFVGEFLTIMGTFIAGDTLPSGYSLPMPRLLGGLAATGVVLGAIYLLWMFQKVFFGKLDKAKNGRLPDLNGRELATFIPLVIGIFLMGLFPRPLLVVMEPAVDKFMRDFGRHVGEPDCAPHKYGDGCDKPAADKAQAEIQKNLDGVAKGAADVQHTMGAAGSAAPAAGSAARTPAAGSAAPAAGSAAPAAGGAAANAGSAAAAAPGRPTP
ncbi:MAG TPA: NADH-quinone oxidoreductase subunit M [Kofleriaceae bacterium]|nr:NADH-quinone oxidoreductase subunit M [Kofleriaceae bacterium]